MGVEPWACFDDGMSASTPDLAALALVLADRSRATMVMALMDGRAWTASELAGAAGVARSTATSHLDLLVASGLIAERRQGRHRYLRIADADSAEAVEALAALADRNGYRRAVPSTLRSQQAHVRLRFARTCYGHLAGRLGVAIADGLRASGLVSDSWELTTAGRTWLSDVGVALPVRTRRALLRPCLDWTERQEHLAGVAADQLLARLLDLGTVRKGPVAREIQLTEEGREQLRALLPSTSINDVVDAVAPGPGNRR